MSAVWREPRTTEENVFVEKMTKEAMHLYPGLMALEIILFIFFSALKLMEIEPLSTIAQIILAIAFVATIVFRSIAKKKKVLICEAKYIGGEVKLYHNDAHSAGDISRTYYLYKCSAYIGDEIVTNISISSYDYEHLKEGDTLYVTSANKHKGQGYLYL